MNSTMRRSLLAALLSLITLLVVIRAIAGTPVTPVATPSPSPTQTLAPQESANDFAPSLPPGLSQDVLAGFCGQTDSLNTIIAALGGDDSAPVAADADVDSVNLTVDTLKAQVNDFEA